METITIYLQVTKEQLAELIHLQQMIQIGIQFLIAQRLQDNTQSFKEVMDQHFKTLSKDLQLGPHFATRTIGKVMAADKHGRPVDASYILFDKSHFLVKQNKRQVKIRTIHQNLTIDYLGSVPAGTKYKTALLTMPFGEKIETLKLSLRP